MKALQVDPLQGSALEHARVAMLGYARDQALALRRANNTVVVATIPDGAQDIALADGFAVARPAAAIAHADVVVVRDCLRTWRFGEHHVTDGTLVVFSSAHALHTGVCARAGFDVVLVTAEGRVAVHRDVTRRARMRAIAYARAACERHVRVTSVALEVTRELASLPPSALLAFASTVHDDDEDDDDLTPVPDIDKTWRGPV